MIILSPILVFALSFQELFANAIALKRGSKDKAGHIFSICVCSIVCITTAVFTVADIVASASG